MSYEKRQIAINSLIKDEIEIQLYRVYSLSKAEMSKVYVIDEEEYSISFSVFYEQSNEDDLAYTQLEDVTMLDCDGNDIILTRDEFVKINNSINYSLIY
jgi:hypothetical protein